LKIGIIVEKFPSISESFILSKVKGLCNRGHQVVVFRNGKLTDEQLASQAQLNKLGNLTLVDMKLPATVVDFTKRVVSNPSIAFNSASLSASQSKQKLVAAIRSKYFTKHPCDVYHFEFSGLNLQYLPLFSKLNAPVFCSCRGTAEKVKPHTVAGRKEALQKLFTAVDGIHCVSNDMAETVMQLGAPQQKIFVNRPAVDVHFFQPAGRTQTSELNILSIGRLTFQKGYLVGLKAMQKVVAAFPNVKWTIVGDGLQKEELLFYINDMKLQQHVELAGAKTKDEILDYYNKADIFFLPSVYEGIANVVLEAMSLQIPVVSSDCSGMAEVITHMSDGLLATNYDSDEMALHLSTLLQDAALRTQISLAARKTIEKHFSIERQLDVFEENYKAMLQPA